MSFNNYDYVLCLRVDLLLCIFFFSSRRRHTRFDCDWSSDVCSSDLYAIQQPSHAHVVESKRGVDCGAGSAAESRSDRWSSPANAHRSHLCWPTPRRWSRQIGRASCRERVESAGVAGCWYRYDETDRV